MSGDFRWKLQIIGADTGCGARTRREEVSVIDWFSCHYGLSIRLHRYGRYSSPHRFVRVFISSPVLPAVHGYA